MEKTLLKSLTLTLITKTMLDYLPDDSNPLRISHWVIRPSDDIDMRISISSSSPLELALSRSVHFRFHTGLRCLPSDSLNY